MAKSEPIGEEFKEASRLRVVWIETAKKLLKDVGVTMTLKLPDEKELQKAIDASSSKKARLFLTLEGTSKLSLEVRVGTSVKMQIGSVNLAAEKDHGKTRVLLTNLSQSTKLITAAEVYKWQETHYDETQLGFFRVTIYEMESEQKKLTEQRAQLEKLTMATGAMRRELKEWAAKRSQKHYIDFVEDIDDGKAAAVIVETYVKTGAKFPVNLPASIKQKIDQTLASGGKPDLAPARANIAKMIDEKIIAKFKLEVLPPIKKELERLSKAIPEKKKAYEKAASGK